MCLPISLALEHFGASPILKTILTPFSTHPYSGIFSSFTHPASSSVAASAESHEHFAPPQHQHPVEEPNGNMKSKDFGNGEGELDMLFGE